MNKSKVVLVQPPIEDFYLTKKRTLPYGLACIAAGIKQKGFDVEILDALATNKSKPIRTPEKFSYLSPFYGENDISLFSLFHGFKHFGYSYEYIATQIRKKEPLVVGISSLFTAYCESALETAQTIKKFYPHCKIVLGGHHPTQFPEKVLDCSAVDFVLRGEGETSMALLCEALRSGRNTEQVPGIAFKKNQVQIISDPAWVKDFEDLPLPATELADHDFYQRKKKRSIMVVSSRGCPMQCSYCSMSASSSYAPFRQRKVEDVFSEIEYQTKDHNVGFIDFEDENLCLNKQWFLKLFSRIKVLFEGRPVELRAMNGLFPPAIDEQIVSLMKDSGFKALNLSLGSTSKKQLGRFKRPDVKTSFEKALCLAQKYDLECVSYIIAAAPGQTAQSSLEDLLFLAQKRTLAGLSIYYPAPGSLDYKLCRDKKILPEDFCLMRSSALPLNDTTSRIEAVTLLRLSRILNFMKHLVDTDGQIPGPEPFTLPGKPLALNRQKISKRLLQWFLQDGKIRGFRPDGGIYTHTVDTPLSLQFIKRMETIHISGIK